MVELETESDDEDIIDVDKKTIEKGEFENNDKQTSMPICLIKRLLCWRQNFVWVTPWKLLRRLSLKIVNILRKEANIKCPFSLNKTSQLQAYFPGVTWKKLLRRMQSLKIRKKEKEKK